MENLCGTVLTINRDEVAPMIAELERYRGIMVMPFTVLDALQTSFAAEPAMVGANFTVASFTEAFKERGDSTPLARENAGNLFYTLASTKGTVIARRVARGV